MQHNLYQYAVYSRVYTTISGSTARASADIRDYFRLREVNRELFAENVTLKNALAHWSGDKGMMDRAGFYCAADSSHCFHYAESQAVRITTNKMKNYLTINRGVLHGVTRDMAVVSPAGVVGQVLECNEHYSVVIPLIHLDSYTSAKIKNNGYFGFMQWDGANYRYSNLKNIPHNVTVSPGDTVVTSGYSAIFPEGLLIGTVKEVGKEEANYLSIRVELAVDFKAIRDLYLIRNPRREEQRQIESSYYE